MRALLLVALAMLAGCSVPPPPPELHAVDPAEVPLEQATLVTLVGAGFVPKVKADLDHPERASFTPYFAIDLDGPQRASLPLVQWVDAMHLTARVPAGLSEGSYDVTVVDAYGRRARLDGGLSVVCANCPDAGDDVGPCDAGYRDWDRDGYGEPGGWGTRCGIPRAPVAGDCALYDALAHPDAGELCNGFDDNCDGVVDEGCATTDGWSGESVGGSNATWRVVVLPAPHLPWLVGEDSAGAEVLDERLPDAGYLSRACPGHWTTGVLDATGTLRLADGVDGGLAHYTAGAPSCLVDVASTAPVAMLRRIPEGGGPVLGVTATGLLDWSGAPTFSPLPLPANVTLTCLGGVSRNELWLGGRGPGGLEAWVLDADGGLTPQGLQGLLSSDHLVSVDAFANGDAVVVGDDGAVAMRLAGTWMTRPKMFSIHIARTWARSPGRVYGVGAGQTLARFNGLRWVPLGLNTVSDYTDLAATTEDELWVVGTKSYVLHWR